MASEVRLRDGSRALTWALLPEDRSELQQRYEQLDERSKYHRFLSAVPHLSAAMLDRLVDDVDGVDHVALVLFVFTDDTVAEPAAVARMVRYDHDPTAADVAVTVAPEFRSRGAASALLDRLVAQRPTGVRRLVTQVAADNDASLAMLRRLGPTRVTRQGDNVLGVEVQLSDEGVEGGGTPRDQDQ